MISVEDFEKWIAEMKEMYQREEEQAVRRRDMEQAMYALAGKDACERLRNYLPMRQAMHQSVTEFVPRKAKKS